MQCNPQYVTVVSFSIVKIEKKSIFQGTGFQNRDLVSNPNGMTSGGETPCLGSLPNTGRKFGCVETAEPESIIKGLTVGKRTATLPFINGYDAKLYWAAGRTPGLFCGRKEKFAGEDTEIGGLGSMGGLGNETWGSCPLVSAASTGLVTRQRVARCSRSLLLSVESVFPRAVSTRVISDAHWLKPAR